MKDLKNKVAVITGAGSGIGRGIAEHAASEGMHIVLADINEEGLNETLEIVKGIGVEAIARVTDVSSRLANRWRTMISTSTPKGVLYRGKRLT